MVRSRKTIRVGKYEIANYTLLERTTVMNGRGHIIFELNTANAHPEVKKKLQIESQISFDGEFYRIREIEETMSGYRYYAQYDLIAMEQFTYLDSKATLRGGIHELLLTASMEIGWSTMEIWSGKDLPTYKRTIHVGLKNMYEVILEIIDTYGAEVQFDNKNKVIKYGVKLTKNQEWVLQDNINIDSRIYTIDSMEYYNAIYPIGKDGMTISNINGGSPILKKKGVWSDDDANAEWLGYKVYVWSDERYTVQENLYNDALDKLDKISQPIESFDIDITDIWSITKDNIKKRKHEGEEINDTDSKLLKTKLTVGDEFSLRSGDSKKIYRAVEIREDILNPFNTKIILATQPAKITSVSKQISDLDEQTQLRDETTRGIFEKTKDQLLSDFNKLEESIQKDLEDYNDEFNKELANAPKLTVEWMNKNTGILNGDTLMVSSIKNKHLTSGSVDTRALQAGSVTADILKVNNAMIDKISSNMLISDLIMAGTIKGNNALWNLDTGRLTNENPDWRATHFAGKMEISNKFDNNVYNRLSSLGLEFFPDFKDRGAGITFQEWSINNRVNRAMGVHHDWDSSIVMGWRNPNTGRNTPYAIFDKHNKLSLSTDAPIIFYERVRFAETIETSANINANFIDNKLGQEWYNGQFNVYKLDNKKISIGIPGGLRIIFDQSNYSITAGSSTHGYIYLYDKGRP